MILILASLVSVAAVDSKGVPTMMERQWGERTAGLAMSIAVAKDTFTRSESVVLNVKLGNFGKTAVPIVIRSPWIDYAYAIRDSRGNEIPMSEHGQRQVKGSERRKIIRDLQPGEFQEDDFELSNGFHLKYPETYTVVASRIFPSPGGADKFIVRSNQVSFHTTR